MRNISDKILDNLNIQRNREKLNEAFPSDMPTVSDVIKAKDLEVLYKHINKNYFRNELPKARLKMAPVAKNFHGKTHVTWNDDGSIDDLLITIATINQKNLNQVINTLAHEMIHVWQFHMYAKTGDRKYADDTYSFLSFGEKNTRGHGHNFKKLQDKLNGQGFEIEVASGINPETELDDEIYGIIFEVDRDEVVFLITKQDPSRYIREIIASVEEKMGAGFFTSYKIIKSTDSMMLLGTRLTKQFELPKNNFRVSYSSSEIDKIVNSSLSKVIYKSTKDDVISKGSEAKVPPSLVQTLQRIHKYRDTSFDSYMKTALYNTEEFKHLYHKAGFRITGKPDPQNGITQEIIDTIREDWLAITDAELKRSSSLKHIVSTLVMEILTRKIPLSDKVVNNILDSYKYNFEERVEFAKFKDLLHEALENDLKKRNKKNPNLYKDIKVIVANVFKGTRLAK